MERAINLKIERPEETRKRRNFVQAKYQIRPENF